MHGPQVAYRPIVPLCSQRVAAGYVSRAEARKGLADLKVPYTSSYLDAFVRGLDHDNDGIISRAYFISFVLVRQEAMRNAFMQLDTNADGKITRKDLRAVAERLGYQLSASELDQVLAVADTDGVGGVSFEEFASHLLLVGDSHPEGTFEQWLAHSAVVFEADTVEVVAEGTADEPWWIAPSSGALAGMCSRTLTAPFDRLRTVLQAWDNQPMQAQTPAPAGATGSGTGAAAHGRPVATGTAAGRPPLAVYSPYHPLAARALARGADAPVLASAMREAAHAEHRPSRPSGAYSSHREHADSSHLSDGRGTQHKEGRHAAYGGSSSSTASSSGGGKTAATGAHEAAPRLPRRRRAAAATGLPPEALEPHHHHHHHQGHRPREHMKPAFEGTPSHGDERGRYGTSHDPGNTKDTAAASGERPRAKKRPRRPPAMHLVNPVDRAVATGRLERAPVAPVAGWSHHSAVGDSVASYAGRGYPVAELSRSTGALAREAVVSRAGGVAGGAGADAGAGGGGPTGMGRGPGDAKIPRAGDAQLAWRGGVETAGLQSRGSGGRGPAGPGLGLGSAHHHAVHLEGEQAWRPAAQASGPGSTQVYRFGAGAGAGVGGGDSFTQLLRQLQIEAESGALSAIAVSRGHGAGGTHHQHSQYEHGGKGARPHGQGLRHFGGSHGMEWEIVFGQEYGAGASSSSSSATSSHRGGHGGVGASTGGAAHREWLHQRHGHSEQGHGHHRSDQWLPRSSKEAARKAKRHGRGEGGTPWRTRPASHGKSYDADAVAEKEDRRAKRTGSLRGNPRGQRSFPHVQPSQVMPEGIPRHLPRPQGQVAAQALALEVAKAGNQVAKAGHAAAHAASGASGAMHAPAMAAGPGRATAAAAASAASSATTTAQSGITDAAVWVHQQSGIKGFWRGNGVNVLKIAPETAVRLGCFEQLKGIVSRDPDNIKPPERFLAGALAGVVSTLIIYPLEVIKTRLALSSTQQYASVVHMVRSIWQREGWRALYKGMGASIMGIVPYSGTELMVFSLLRDAWSARYPDREPGVPTLLMSGAAASACGQLVSYPLQLVRTRLQAQGMKGRPVLYKGVLDCFRKTLKADGFLGLYRGIAPGFMKSIPSCMISFTVYDSARSQLRRMQPKKGSGKRGRQQY